MLDRAEWVRFAAAATQGGGKGIKSGMGWISGNHKQAVDVSTIDWLRNSHRGKACEKDTQGGTK